MFLAVAAGLCQRHLVHISANLQHTGLFQRLTAVEPVHKLIVAFFALAENDGLFQPGFLDTVDQVLVVLPGSVLDVGAGEGLNVSQLDKPQIIRGLGIGHILGQFGRLFALVRFGGGSAGGLGVRRGLGRFRGLPALVSLGGSVSGGLGVRRVLGRFGGLLALIRLGGGSAGGLGVGCVLVQFGGLLTLVRSGRGRCVGDRGTERAFQGIFFSCGHIVFLLFFRLCRKMRVNLSNVIKLKV